jgi:hypothetical protein
VIRPLPSRRDADDEGGPIRVPAVLDQVLAGLGAPAVADVVLVHDRWAEVVGDELVDHAAPISIEDGTLRVEVDGPAWASHLRWAEVDIVTRLDRLIGPGVVTSVSTRVRRR